MGTNRSEKKKQFNNSNKSGDHSLKMYSQEVVLTSLVLLCSNTFLAELVCMNCLTTLSFDLWRRRSYTRNIDPVRALSMSWENSSLPLAAGTEDEHTTWLAYRALLSESSGSANLYHASTVKLAPCT